jgi:hypothetical protein
MKGLIKEGSAWMEEDAEPEVMDAGLIAAAQRVEHYEMAGYGTVHNFAELLGEEEDRFHSIARHKMRYGWFVPALVHGGTISIRCEFRHLPDLVVPELQQLDWIPKDRRP